MRIRNLVAVWRRGCVRVRRLLLLTAAVACSTPAYAEEWLRRGAAWLVAGTTPYAGVGAKFAFNGDVTAPGIVTMVSVGTDGIAVLPGVQMTVRDILIFAAAGPEYRFRGGIGVRAHAEFWVRPTATTSASLVMTCGTANAECWLRARYGMKAFGAYVGPEVVVASDRAGTGLALTGLRVGALEVELAAGAERDWNTRSLKPYGTLAIVRAF